MVAGLTSCACAPVVAMKTAAARRLTALLVAAVRRLIPFLPGSDAKRAVCFNFRPCVETVLPSAARGRLLCNSRMGKATSLFVLGGLSGAAGSAKVSGMVNRLRQRAPLTALGACAALLLACALAARAAGTGLVFVA